MQKSAKQSSPLLLDERIQGGARLSSAEVWGTVRVNNTKKNFSTIISEASLGTCRLICSGFPRCRSLEITTSHSWVFDVEISGNGLVLPCVLLCPPTRIFVIPMCGQRPRVFF